YRLRSNASGSGQCTRACSHYAQGLDDECECEEPKEKRVEFLEAREDTTEAFESAEETFDLVALLVNGMIVVPGMQAVGLRRNHRNHAQVEHQLPGFVAFVRPIH